METVVTSRVTAMTTLRRVAQTVCKDLVCVGIRIHQG